MIDPIVAFLMASGWMVAILLVLGFRREVKKTKWVVKQNDFCDGWYFHSFADAVDYVINRKIPRIERQNGYRWKFHRDAVANWSDGYHCYIKILEKTPWDHS